MEKKEIDNSDPTTFEAVISRCPHRKLSNIEKIQEINKLLKDNSLDPYIIKQLSSILEKIPSSDLNSAKNNKELAWPLRMAMEMVLKTRFQALEAELQKVVADNLFDKKDSKSILQAIGNYYLHTEFGRDIYIDAIKICRNVIMSKPALRDNLPKSLTEDDYNPIILEALKSNEAALPKIEPEIELEEQSLIRHFYPLNELQERIKQLKMEMDQVSVQQLGMEKVKHAHAHTYAYGFDKFLQFDLNPFLPESKRVFTSNFKYKDFFEKHSESSIQLITQFLPNEVIVTQEEDDGSNSRLILTPNNIDPSMLYGLRTRAAPKDEQSRRLETLSDFLKTAGISLYSSYADTTTTTPSLSNIVLISDELSSAESQWFEEEITMSLRRADILGNSKPDFNVSLYPASADQKCRILIVFANASDASDPGISWKKFSRFPETVRGDLKQRSELLSKALQRVNLYLAFTQPEKAESSNVLGITCSGLTRIQAMLCGAILNEHFKKEIPKKLKTIVTKNKDDESYTITLRGSKSILESLRKIFTPMPPELPKKVKDTPMLRESLTTATESAEKKDRRLFELNEKDAQQTKSALASLDLYKTAQFVHDSYLNKPYTAAYPKGAEGIKKDDEARDFEGRIVNRHNNNIVNAIRVQNNLLAVIEFLAKYPAGELQKFCERIRKDPDYMKLVQAVIWFSQTGRESSMGFNDNSVEYLKYRTKAAENLAGYLKSKNFPEPLIKSCSEALRELGNPGYNLTDSPGDTQHLQVIFSLANTLDLFRVRTQQFCEQEMMSILQKAKVFVKPAALMPLEEYAIKLLDITGNRLCAFKGSEKEIPQRPGYNKKIFGHLSTDIPYLMSTIASVQAPCYSGNLDIKKKSNSGLFAPLSRFLSSPIHTPAPKKIPLSDLKSTKEKVADLLKNIVSAFGDLEQFDISGDTWLERQAVSNPLFIKTTDAENLKEKLDNICQDFKRQTGTNVSLAKNSAGTYNIVVSANPAILSFFNSCLSELDKKPSLINSSSGSSASMGSTSASM